MRRRRAPARAHALTLSRRAPRAPRVAQWFPSGRSLAIGFGLLAAAAVSYVIARETAIFAVQRIDVRGAPPALAAQIRSALAPIEGESLVAFSGQAARRRLAGLPQIASVGFDRDFPHTLRIWVRVERPVAVLRRGSEGWLVSQSGRVLATLGPGSFPPLPRIWLAAETDVTVGAQVDTGDAIAVAAALRDARFRSRVMSVRDGGRGRLSLQLGSGVEVRLGDLTNLAVKLAVAAAVVPRSPGALYVDVSVPTRAVAGYSPSDYNSQVSGQG